MQINNKNQLGNSSKVALDALKNKGAMFYYERAVKHYNAGDKEEAEKDFNQAISVENDNALAYYNRGTFYYNEKKYKPAIDDFMKATKFRAGFAEAYYNLACSYVQILSFREGLNMLKRAIKYDKKMINRAINDPDFENVNRMKEFKDMILIGSV
ncbi:MAG: tetratricopeptide repeat protein [Candidatus Sericytochromatia bacterium]